MRKKYFLINLFLISIFLTGVVLAQTDQQANSENWFSGETCLEIPLPFIEGCPSTPAQYLSGLYRLAILIAIVAAIIMIVIAGITFATSGDNAAKQKEAREQIRDAIIGLVLILASVLILRTINPALVSLELPGLHTQLSDEEYQEEQLKKMEETQKKLYERCTQEICAQFTGDTAFKCIEACQSLYQVTTMPDPEECFKECCKVWIGSPPTPINNCYSKGQINDAGRACALKCHKSLGGEDVPLEEPPSSSPKP